MYRNYPVSKAMQGDKYKTNFSLSEETVQKIQYIQAMEGINMREYSKIAELAIDLLYDLKYKTNKRLTNMNSVENIRNGRY